VQKKEYDTRREVSRLEKNYEKKETPESETKGAKIDIPRTNSERVKTKTQ
jgi:hypothetical protein